MTQAAPLSPLHRDDLEEIRRSIVGDPDRLNHIRQGQPGIRRYLDIYGQVREHQAAARAIAIGAGDPDAVDISVAALPSDWYAWLEPKKDD